MKEGLIGFATKTKTGESLKVDHVGKVDILSLMKNGCVAGINCFQKNPAISAEISG